MKKKKIKVTFDNINALLTCVATRRLSRTPENETEILSRC